jgi:hypothetical protein
MCPDKQMLSLFFDKELPSPWKEKLEAHVENCHSCKKILGSFSDMSVGLKNTNCKIDNDSVKPAQDRLWNKIKNNFDIYDNAAAKNRKPFLTKSLWSRSIEVPIPFAAAAALIVVLFLAILFTQTVSNNTATPAIAASETNGAIVPVNFEEASSILQENMADILRYLETEDSNDIVIVKLPDQKKFKRYGEPTMLKASDYPRSAKY